MCLQRLGKVLNVTPSQNIIIKSDKPPKIGIDVVDEGLKVVGKTFDIIGPISSPYIIVKPKIKDPKRLVGKKLYMLFSRNKRRKR
jgi:RNA-binding protein